MCTKYEVQPTIPTVLILNHDGSLISREAKNEIEVSFKGEGPKYDRVEKFFKTFLGVILAEKSKKHIQKIHKKISLTMFWPQNPTQSKNMGFEVKKCPKHG